MSSAKRLGAPTSSERDVAGDEGATTSTSSSARGCVRHALRASRAAEGGRRAARYLPYSKAPRRPPAEREGEEEGILSIALPPREAADADAVRRIGFGSLFRVCTSCRRRITESDPVFLYGVLHAFCSMECRHKKMELDGDINE